MELYAALDQVKDFLAVVGQQGGPLFASWRKIQFEGAHLLIWYVTGRETIALAMGD